MNLARERNQHPAALRLRGTSNGDGVLQVQCTILSDAIWSTLRTSDDHWLLASMPQVKQVRSVFLSIGGTRYYHGVGGIIAHRFRHGFSDNAQILMVEKIGTCGQHIYAHNLMRATIDALEQVIDGLCGSSSR